MKRVNLVVFIALLLGLAAPVTVGSGDGLGDYWTGRPSKDLVASWGEPSKIKTRSGGTRVFVYRLVYRGEREVDSPGWYFNEENRPQNTTVPPERRSESAVIPWAVIIPGRVGDTKTKRKKKIRFFVDGRGYVSDVRSD